MKPRALLAAIFLAVLTAIPTMASAAFVHYFDCDQCHRDGATWNTVDAAGVCISCHDSAGDAAFDFGARTRPDDGATGGVVPPGFATGDASTQISNPSAATGSSHNWGAVDRNPAAGASPASSLMYSTRRGAARGFVTCYKCHDPHSYYDADYATGNEKMLRTVAIGDGTSTNSEQNIEAMCTECHLDWASVAGVDRGFKSHPLDVSGYNTMAAGDARFKPFAPAGTMTLLAGETMGCSTCHGVHGTTSGGANDGAILKGPGLSIDDQAVCTACHEYMSHPSSSGPATEMGCLVCHSGHSYNDGTPNYFVLRDTVNVPAGVSLPTAGTTITGLRYTSLATTGAERAALYAGVSGDDGYCTGCHGAITGTGPGEPSEVQTHTGAEDCSQCHSHYDPASPDNSFTGKGCNGCHGYPPTQNIAGGDPNAGWASDLAGTGHDYDTNNGAATLLNEANTPHGTHAASNPISNNVDCKTCHNAHIADFAAQHNNSGTGPTFQNVLEGAYAMPALADAGGTLSPTYTGGTTTCAAVYCHSNGGAYNATGKVLADYTTTSVSWNGTNGTINDCSSCHDDNVSGIGTGPKNNSPAHDVHVTRYDAVDVAGSSCNLCHVQTTDGSTIDTPGNHVDGTVQLATDSTFVIDTVSSATLGGFAGSAASCAVYCHSDGNGNFSNPAWDDGAAAGACGACHSVDPATIDTIQGGGAHFLHLSDANGPGIASCDVCHTHDGSFAPNNGHIDKSKLTKADACDTCHGKPGTGWVAAPSVDESPDWTDPTTVRCETCHSGTPGEINAVTAPLVDETAYANGHGKGGVAQVCTDCHEAALVAGHLGGATIDRINSGLPAYVAADDRAFCNACHATPVNNHNVLDGTVCKTCHAQHGESNGFDAMIKSSIAGNTVTGFAAQGARASYVNAAFTGVCQTCHNTTTTKYFSPNKYEDLTHNPGQACSDCHQHDSAPGFTGVGDSCDSCHGYPPATAAHAVHAPDSVTADGLGKVYRDGTNGFADVTACVYCHTGADLYTYSPSADQASATPGRQNHNVSEASQDATLLASVGYNTADGSCASACHLADNTRADWATGFTFPAACDACHGNAPATGGSDTTAHADHITAGLTCVSCHDSDPVDTAHIGTFAGADEITRVTSMTNALAANVTVNEPSWVANANRTCSTSVCHNPSPGASKAANWDTSTSSCTLCHESGDPATGSHTQHLAASVNTTFKITVGCTDCHGDTTSGGTDMAHRSATVELAGTITTYTGDQNDFTNTTWGTCSTTTCHNDGLGVAKVSPTWGRAPSAADDCTICHTEPPTGGSHTSHTNASVTCTSCHNTVVPGTTAPDQHLDNNVDVFNAANNLGYTANAALGSATWTSCNTLTCHNDGQGTANGTTAPSAVVTPAWGDNAASCGQCHAASPVSAKHDEHLGAYGATCGDCHAGVTDGSTLPTANHINGTIDVITNMGGNAGFNYSLGSVGMAPADGWGTCADPTSGCHGTTEARPWDATASSCTSCHGASGTTGEPLIAGDMISTNPLGQHDTHVNTNGYGCNTCHNGHGMPTIDDKVTISFTGLAAGGAYDPPAQWVAGKWLYDQVSVSATQDCSNLYCHSSGQADGGVAAPTYATADWGNAASGACGTCHSDTDPATGAHNAHINGFVTLDCTTCHSGNTHVNQAVEVSTGTYTSAGAVGNGYGTCSTASCHRAGLNPTAALDYVVTPNWGTDSPNCNVCHASTPTNTSHVVHVVTEGNDCSACHTGATKDTTYTLAAHLDGNVDVAVGTYTANKAYGDPLESCSGISCHDDGRNGGTTPVWDTVVNDCSECHATQPATASHPEHIALYACGVCHTNAVEATTPPNNHRDGNIETAASVGYSTPKAKGTAYESCSTNICHGTVSEVWGTDLSAVDQCTKCHGEQVAGPATDAQKAPGGAGVDTNGDSLATDAQVGAHQVHLNPSITSPLACDSCHTVPGTVTAAGHIDSALPAELTWGGIATANTTTPVSCATTYCHDGSAIKNGATWDNGTLAPTWTDTNFIQGTVADCDNCHGYPPAGGHVANSDCSVCHFNVTGAADDSFVDVSLHVDGILQTEGGDNCTDCHNADIDNALNGVHGSHADTVAYLAGKTVSGGDYGGAGWYGTTYSGGQPQFGCGQCHDGAEGTGHPVNGLNVDIDPAGETPGAGNVKTFNGAQSTPTFITKTSVTCASVYCHSDAAGTFQTTPDWYGGTVSGNCNDCHGNWPTTNAHQSHQIGIHMDDIYTGTTGTLTQGAADPVDHGTATLSTLGCQTCHNGTVTISRNDKADACVACHDLDGNPMVVAIASTTHINGLKDVVFENATYKTKAQLRDDITGVVEVNTYWSRTTYKQAASVDTSKLALQGTASFAAGSCSTVACHNGNTATWTDSAVDCTYCHTDLPQ